MSTATASRLSLSLLVAACMLSMSACKTGSTKPSAQQTEAPEVRCKQPATAPLAKACAASDWVRWEPGPQGGKAQLSECAVSWMTSLLATLTDERKLRAVEHKCLDEHAKRGDIRQ